MKNKEKIRLKRLESAPVEMDARARIALVKEQRQKNALIGLKPADKTKK